MTMSLSSYLEESGLRTDPFADTADEALFFSTPQIVQRLNLLHHLVQYSDLLLLVVGKTGSGKTTLLNRLISTAAGPWRVSVVEADIDMTPERLAAGAISSFDLAEGADPETGGSKNLDAYLQRWAHRAQTPVLIIDEAHLLPPETLKGIIRLTSNGSRTRLRTLLLGEPQLEAMADGAVGGSRVQTMTHVVDLPPLSEAQVADYVQFRLQRAGLSPEGLFSPQAIRRLHRDSSGLPGLVNQAAREILADRLVSDQASATREARPVATPAEPPQRRPIVLKAAGLALLAGLGLWLLLAPERPPDAPRDLPLPPSPGSAREPAIAPVPGSILEPDVHAPEPVLEPDEPAPAVTVMPLQPSPEPELAPQAVEVTPPVSPVEKAPPAPALPPQRDPRVATSREKGPAIPDPAPIKPSPPPAPSQATARRSPGEAWLLKQDGAHYTVQLTGSRDHQSALDFIRRRGLQGKAHWLLTTHRQKDWYVVVSGVYTSREAAIKAIRALPPDLRRHGPWARSVSSVREVLRNKPGEP